MKFIIESSELFPSKTGKMFVKPIILLFLMALEVSGSCKEAVETTPTTTPKTTTTQTTQTTTTASTTTTTPRPPCDAGWTLFDRAPKWCVQVFSGHMDQSLAQAECLKVGSNLTGYLDLAEATKIADLAYAATNLATGSVWVGLQRTPQCYDVNKTSSTCTPTTTYEWLDGHTPNTYFGFETNQPSYGPDVARCGMLAFTKPGVPSFQENGVWRRGYLDDVRCNVAVQPITLRKQQAYACGKPANV